MQKQAMRFVWIYALVLATTGAALVLRLALAPWLGDAAPFATFVVSIIVSAWVGGLWPGLLATALGLALGQWFFIPSRFTFAVVSPQGPLQHVVFAAIGVGISALSQGRLREMARNRRLTASLRALASELTQVEQRERRRLAQVLHDHLQQLLAVAKMRVDMFLGRSAKDDPLRRIAMEIGDLLRQSIEAARSLTVELSPPVLYDSGLGAALEWLGRWMSEKHQVAVEVEADPQAEPASEDTRVLLFQATRELLFNVSKHAGTRRAKVQLACAGGAHACITVADEGRGFDLATLGGDKSVGGGFGLFSIRERLAVLGGRLDLSSSPGRGTRARLVVPLGVAVGAGPAAAGAAAGQAAPAAAAPRGAALRVLLADDHKIMREGVAGLLEGQAGIEVIAQAADGQEAVDLARRHRPDVVVMDVSMPRLSGIEATRIIARELPDVRVIALSMHLEKDMAAAMRRAGAVAYLSKDGPVETLIAAIRNCTPQTVAHGAPAPTTPPGAGAGVAPGAGAGAGGTADALPARPRP